MQDFALPSIILPLICALALFGVLRFVLPRIRNRIRRTAQELELSKKREHMLEIITADRMRAEDALRIAYSEMERRVQERTDELRLSNDQLQASQREYQELVNTVDGIVWEADVGKQGYTFVSRQAERILGYPIERWQSEKNFWKSILHPDDRDRMTGEYYVHADEKKDSQMEYRVLTSDGRTLWVRDYVKVIYEAGKPSKMRGIMVDVTERKKAEVELRYAQQAALEAARVKSEFLANMSHEIRTPLNAIIGMASVSLDQELTELQRESMTTIKSAADTLLMLINDILDFSKIEAGKLEFEPSDFRLTSLCRSAADVILPLARAKEISLTTDISTEVPPELRGDPGRLLQILLNLLSNAVKFTNKGGKISLDVSGKGTAPDGAHVIRFEIVDTGVGILPEAQDKLFQPFTQADASMTRKFGGTGLGLSICKRLTELMHGQIGVESEHGKGSKFWLELPLRRALSPVIETEAEAPQIQPHERSKKRILVVDDNPANQKVFLRFLSKLGYSAEAVADGREAIMAHNTGIFDLILMDCQMPEIDGYTATRKIRANEAEWGRSRLPIVALTAHAMAGDREKCQAAGMDDYLSKPVSLQQLGRMLDHWLKPSADAPKVTPPPPPVVAAPKDHGLAEKISNEVLIDSRYLKELDELKEEGQPDLVMELIDIFRNSGPDRISRIKNAIEQSQSDTIRKEAHAFKSTCYNVGARKLAAVCQAIEDSGRTDKPQPPAAEPAQFIILIEENYSMALSELTRIYNERKNLSTQPAA